MRTGAAAAVTYDQEFIAVRHESDLLTPLFHAPLVSLSVRELGYVGAFVICAMLSFTGSAPPWLAAAGLVLAAAAFFRWRGEMPEMYLYYAALAGLAPSGRGGARRRKGRGGAVRRRGPLAALLGRGQAGGEAGEHQVVGPGAEHVLGSDAPDAAGRRAGAAVERVVIADGGKGDGGGAAPADLALDIGAAHGHAGVIVRVDGAELVRDTANGEGQITVTLIPRAGLRRIEVLDAASGGAIASHAVEFVDAGDGGAGDAG